MTENPRLELWGKKLTTASRDTASGDTARGDTVRLVDVIPSHFGAPSDTALFTPLVEVTFAGDPEHTCAYRLHPHGVATILDTSVQRYERQLAETAAGTSSAQEQESRNEVELRAASWLTLGPHLAAAHRRAFKETDHIESLASSTDPYFCWFEGKTDVLGFSILSLTRTNSAPNSTAHQPHKQTIVLFGNYSKNELRTIEDSYKQKASARTGGSVPWSMAISARPRGVQISLIPDDTAGLFGEREYRAIKSHIANTKESTGDSANTTPSDISDGEGGVNTPDEPACAPCAPTDEEIQARNRIAAPGLEDHEKDTAQANEVTLRLLELGDERA